MDTHVINLLNKMGEFLDIIVQHGRQWKELTYDLTHMIFVVQD
jgi:hypothetical protein